MRSSYIENNMGEVLKAYVIGWRPGTLVELGVLDGYSTIAIAEGIKELQELYGMNCKLQAYDLFEDYPYNHGSKEEVEKALADKGLSGYVDVIKGDAYEVYKNYADDSIQFLHVDISNAGDTLKKIVELWTPKIISRGLILFEGGSEERDNIEWMIKSGRPPIKKELETNEFIQKTYMYGTYWQFPSITVLLKRW